MSGSHSLLETYLIIRVPPDVLFPDAFKVSRLPLWFHLAGRMEAGPDWPGTGARFRSRTIFAGREIETEGLVQECVSPERLQVETWSTLARARWAFDFQPWGQATRLFIRVAYELSDGGLGSLPHELFHKLLYKHIELSLQALRALGEYRSPAQFL